MVYEVKREVNLTESLAIGPAMRALEVGELVEARFSAFVGMEKAENHEPTSPDSDICVQWAGQRDILPSRSDATARSVASNRHLQCTQTCKDKIRHVQS